MRKNIVLIGFMGSGKSSVAKELSRILKREWIDSDNYIERSENKDIPSIFKEKGETYFRALEAGFIQSFLQTGKHSSKHSEKNAYIISTGGGMPIFNNIKNLGLSFYLKCDFHIIVSRIESDKTSTRPLFSDLKKAHKLYAEREKIYEMQSDIIVDANRDLASVLREILERLSERSLD